jgi:S-adenosylmethionine:tRNA ribosyltransferase-isomerase
MIRPQDYWYELPPDRIALYPLPERDASRLLVYRKGDITHDRFTSLATHLPQNAVLFFNDTKVIQARLLFEKKTGARIEVFLLSPLHPTAEVSQAMSATAPVVWKCTIGNLKKWKNEMLSLYQADIGLFARLINRTEGSVELSWNPPHHTFAEIVSRFGHTPLPPYIHRAPEQEDEQRYQTVYSRHEGAVAAPTAGLHFTDRVFESLRQKKITWDFLTLHVSAGTFQPIKTEDAAQHVMHDEQVVVERHIIEHLLNPDKYVVAVGTTSLRTLESLYWYGVKLLKNREAPFIIEQDEPYRIHARLPEVSEAFHAIAERMHHIRADHLTGHTRLYIYPGYTFRVCRALITNFHQPGSTLMLLVAAFVGESWRKIYQEALQHDYRFLSYGDSSLLIP